MAIRVTLLVVITSLFALMWTGDSSVESRQETRTVAQATLAPARPVDAVNEAPSLDEALVQTVEELVALPIEDGVNDPDSRYSATEVQLCEVPWPDAMAPGDYRIVSSYGDVLTRVVSADDLRYFGIEVEDADRALYRTRDLNCRWYFIRVQEEDETLAEINSESTHEIVIEPEAMREAWRTLARGGERWLRIVERGGKLFQTAVATTGQYVAAWRDNTREAAGTASSRLRHRRLQTAIKPATAERK